MLYAMVVIYGTLINGVSDTYFYDVRGFQDMKKCEDAKVETMAYVKSIHPWVTVVRGACVPATLDASNTETTLPPSP